MKKIKENMPFFITTVFIVLLMAVIVLSAFFNQNTSADKEELRIASLSPSITEFIYDIGYDKYLTADTIYCNYPEDAKNKFKIGSFNDVNYEYIASLKINVAVIQQNMDKQKEILNRMGIKTIEINNNTIEDIINAYDILGNEFNIREITDIKKANIINKINNIKSKVKHYDNITAFVSIFREYNEDVTSITVAGGKNIYNDILNILNINNPFKDFPPYTNISMESIIKTNPDVIFDMYHGEKAGSALNDWQNIPVKAVKNNHIFVLADTYLTLPGPRIDMIIEEFYNQLEKGYYK